MTGWDIVERITRMMTGMLPLLTDALNAGPRENLVLLRRLAAELSMADVTAEEVDKAIRAMDEKTNQRLQGK